MDFNIGDYGLTQQLSSSLHNEINFQTPTGPIDNSYFPTLDVYHFGGSLGANPISAEYSTAVAGGALLAGTDYLATFPNANTDGLFSNSAANDNDARRAKEAA